MDGLYYVHYHLVGGRLCRDCHQVKYGQVSHPQGQGLVGWGSSECVTDPRVGGVDRLWFRQVWM